MCDAGRERERVLPVGREVSVRCRPKAQAMHADNAHASFSQGSHGDHITLLNVYNQWKESGYEEG